MIFLKQTISLRKYSVATILQLLFMAHTMLFPILNVLYFYISTFRSVCAVPNMAVSCSSLISCFPDKLHSYFLNDSEIVLVTSIISSTTSVFTFHMRWISNDTLKSFRLLSSSHFCLLKSQYLYSFFVIIVYDGHFIFYFIMWLPCHHHPFPSLRSSLAGSQNSTTSQIKHFLFTVLPKPSWL
jgi:hypothetical protein